MVKPRSRSRRLPRRYPPRRPTGSRSRQSAQRPARKVAQAKSNKPQRLWLLVTEVFFATTIVLLGGAVILGYAARSFAGAELLASLLPFGFTAIVLLAAAAALLLGWLQLRGRLYRTSPLLPAIAMASLALVTMASIPQSGYRNALLQYKILLGGRAEVSRQTLSHQVFATYRRLDQHNFATLTKRAAAYTTEIDQAAVDLGLDPHLLYGLAAVESSFLPRTSTDGGEGLFQITRPPGPVIREVASQLPEERHHHDDTYYNALLGAATLKHYLAEMDGDLFLGLLAYNIGPSNGGLRFIMDQYRAKDFITIQPYLAKLPRDYPIRVLAYALAFRVYHQAGALLPYDKEQNAIRVQKIGIPGL